MIFVFGDINLDILVRPDDQLHYGSDTTGTIVTSGGGSAANFAAWAAHLGSDVFFAGRVGADPAGQIAAADLRRFGVAVQSAASETAPTGMIAVLVDNAGERTMVTARGANLEYSIDDIPDDRLAGAQHLHITGYSMVAGDPLESASLEMIARAKKNRIPISVDPSSSALLEEYGAERFLQNTSGADVIFPNLDEGRVLTRCHDPEEIVDFLVQTYPVVALTLGGKGCLIANGDKRLRIGAVPTALVDSTGAGDSFAAAFVTATMQAPGNYQKAGEVANHTAAACVAQLGARPPLSSAAERV